MGPGRCRWALPAWALIWASMATAGGIPQVEIFTLQPLVLGQPNVLVCSVRNIFPPVARIRWALQDQELTQGVFSTPTYPVQVLDFQIFSYLEVTPQADDIYSCTVKGLGGKFDTMAYWVPKDPIASKLLENVLCGLAVALGGVFIILGVVLLALSFRMPPPGLLLLLLVLALSAPPAGAFVLHLETDSLLSADGGVLEQNWVLFFNKMPFTCYDFSQSQFVPCGLGASVPWNYTGVPVAQWLAQNAPGLPQESAQQCQ
ncbi:HLA class II histocompatibility antigen, DM alpha chain-like, partial [Protobothrops mucrosquamatus]|uniref:HLA class II histocompatibility antigen, DM alpha chain-like n=1 Tax=Protobothrops mucrosquamatus TaxID=103944 RepID=UPI0007757048